MIRVSVAAISRWLNPLVSKGVLVWFDESGAMFQDAESPEKAKRFGKTYVRINGSFGLPKEKRVTPSRVVAQMEN